MKYDILEKIHIGDGMKRRNICTKNNIIALLAIGCLLYFVGFWWGTEKDTTQEYEKKAEKAMIADTEILAHNGRIYNMDGEPADIQDLYNDKAVLIYFWMPWSEDSKRGLPVLDELYGLYGQEVHFVILSVGNTEKEARAYYQQQAYEMPFYTGSLSIADAYNIYEVPQCVMIRKGGAIADQRIGVPAKREWEYIISRAIEE